ncbi:hypothetical protein D3C75_778020 [compost metagenome]
MIDEHSQRCAESPVQQPQSPGALGEVQVLGCLQHGQHDGLERNQHRHDAQEVDDSAQSGFGPCQLIGGNRRDEHDAQQPKTGNDEVVQEQSRIVDEFPDIRVIAERQMLRQGDYIGHDLAEAF